MTIVEGKGYISPKPIRIILLTNEVSHVRAFAKDLSKKKGFNERNCFIGWLGESALSKYLEQQTNIKHLCNCSILPGGDGGIDVKIFDIDVQIKTKHQSSTCSIVKVKNGQLLSYKCNVFVFGGVVSELFSREQVIDLLGWVELQEMENWGKISVKKQLTFSTLDQKYLQPMSRLVHKITARQLLGVS